MQLVIRNGKTYHEYTPQEIFEIRLRQLTHLSLQRGGKAGGAHHLMNTSTVFADAKTRVRHYDS